MSARPVTCAGDCNARPRPRLVHEDPRRTTDTISRAADIRRRGAGTGRGKPLIRHCSRQKTVAANSPCGMIASCRDPIYQREPHVMSVASLLQSPPPPAPPARSSPSVAAACSRWTAALQRGDLQAAQRAFATVQKSLPQVSTNVNASSPAASSRPACRQSARSCNRVTLAGARNALRRCSRTPRPPRPRPSSSPPRRRLPRPLRVPCVARCRHPRTPARMSGTLLNRIG